jgi:hypothetical protein
MLVGDPLRFAIQAEVLHHADDACLGRFRFWARGCAIGDYEDHALLGAIAEWLRDCQNHSGRRNEPALDAMSPDEVFAAAYDPYYADGEEGRWSGNEVYQGAFTRLHITHVGMSAFSEEVGVMLLETGDGQQRLLWRRWADMASHDAYLEPGEFERVTNAFLRWVDANYSEHSSSAE